MDETDFLTCGGCQTEFPLNRITIFMEHKKSDCVGSSSPRPDYGVAHYTCYTCPQQFSAAVSLLYHAQKQHQLKIFRDRTNIETENLPSSAHLNSTEEDVPATAQDSAEFYSDVTEPFSKCCASIMPKKRKRHFEMKHRTSFFKAARLRRQQSVGSSSDIYINVDPSSINVSGDGKSESVAVNQSSHSTLVPMGQMVTIPITNGSSNSSLGNYFGISYSDSARATGGTTTSSLDGLGSSPATSTVTAALSESVVSTSASAAKKKYPISKPFKCDSCGDSFNQRIHLKKHQSKHTGVKPYKCKECDYATVERSHLKVHIRIHTGEKPYKCNHCEYSTAQNSTLKTHSRRHHGQLLSLQFPEQTQVMWHTQQRQQLGNSPPTETPAALSPAAKQTN